MLKKIFFPIITLFYISTACQSELTTLPTNTYSDSQEVFVLVEDNALLKHLSPPNQPTPLDQSILIEDTLHYTINAELQLVNQGPGQSSKHRLWLALIQSITPYQSIESVKIFPSDYILTKDEFDNLYAQFSFGNLPIGEIQTVKVEYQVSVNRLKYNFGNCQGQLPNFFLEPELHIEVNNPDIEEIANRLETTGTICDQIRAYYDHIGDSLNYTFNGGNWGAQAASGPMGADCTEYASLLIALCRNTGIPARYLEGIIYRGNNQDVEAQLEHAWVEIFFPQTGWTPIDPTLGRLKTTRDRYFGKFPADHIIVTKGRNPSTLRGNSYFSHLYWGSDQTTIKVLDFKWTITPFEK